SGSWKWNIHITYKELNEKSNSLAYTLQEKGVGPDTIVGIMIERSVEMIIGILGILKAGGAYLPIDTDYPGDRIDFMLKDSGSQVLLTDSANGMTYEKNIVCIPDAINRVPTMTITYPQPATRNPQLAYVIYTSGTTGKPKGVLVEHRNIVGLMVNNEFLFDFDKHDVWTLFHSYCFDFSVWEMYGALLYGGRLVVIPKTTARDPQCYRQVLIRQGVTVLNQTPSAFYNLAAEELKHPRAQLNLRWVIFGGEALKPSKLRAWRHRCPGTRTRLV
ncbi:MAG: AMP-binding protein, partial [bacterium]|nr:AMP-binding protein [bacterium]